MNIDNLVNELLAGKTSDELAAELAEALNTAIKEKEEIDREAEERRIAEEAKKAEAEIIFEHKKDAIANTLVAFCDYLELCDVEEEFIQKIENVNDEELEDLVVKFDEMLEGVMALYKMATLLKDKSEDGDMLSELLSSMF